MFSCFLTFFFSFINSQPWLGQADEAGTGIDIEGEGQGGLPLDAGQLRSSTAGVGGPSMALGP